MNNLLKTSFTIKPYTYEHRYVMCNKPTCNRCPHGPYWYMIIAIRNGKHITKYIGKTLPKGINPPCPDV